MSARTALWSAELLKFRTLRGNLVTLVLSAVVLAGAGFALARSDGATGDGLLLSDPVSLPMEYAAYVVMILGALVVTADIDAGTLRLTSLLVPRRGTVLVAKLGAVTMIGLVTAVPTLVLVVAAAVLGSDDPSRAWSSVLDGPWTSGVLAPVLAMALAAILGAATGFLVRSTALAIALLLFWSFVVETVVVVAAPASVSAYLPFKTIGTSRQMVGELGSAEGLALFAAYTAVAVGLAALLQRRRTSVD